MRAKKWIWMEKLTKQCERTKNVPKVQMWYIDIWAIHAGKIPSEFTWVSSSDEFSWYALTHGHLIRKCILIWLENAWCHNHSSELSLHSATERDNESDNLCNCSLSPWKSRYNCRNIKILITARENTQSKPTNAIEKCANFALSWELCFMLMSGASSRIFSNFCSQISQRAWMTTEKWY